ncbi:uncharacterized protein LOC133525550 isoform X3 [Cydia pomonella]|uniref:uncharacterized protein LOC133525550 isoform X3 n=1 Tax=Cydia pomonella TaxID=82600 RepID=UPI002ADE55CD|nr:uncharacterized protein LOC133525550 isoform X3 [Cydia pomonella]
MEAPEFKRCCFCLPLRRGLIAWGYVKVGLAILMLIYTSLMLHFWAYYGLRFFSADLVIYIFISACSIIDILFNIVFIVAGHKKSIKLLKVSYVYNMVWLGLLTLGTCLILYSDIDFIHKIWPYVENHMYIMLEVLTGSGLAISLIFIQIYVILLIRSELRKLQNQTIEMQFTNHVEEPLCTLHKESDTNHCTDKK